jgi:hypothetical protein
MATIIDYAAKDSENRARIRIVEQDGTKPAVLSIGVNENGINIILLDSSDPSQARPVRFTCRNSELRLQ